MRGTARVAVLLLISYPIFVLAQNPAAQESALPPTAVQNSILNLYDAFGYQKRGTILDWGFSALVHYNGNHSL